jgi:hypothetical protein
MAVRTVTVEMNLNATSFLADGRAVVTVNDEMARSFGRLSRDAQLASNATNDMSRNIAQMGRRAGRAERQIRELREEIDRLTASSLAARGPVNIINGNSGPGGGMGGGRGLFGMLRNLWSKIPQELQITIITVGAILGTMLITALGASIAAAMTLMLGGVVVAAMAAIAAKTSPAVQGAFRRMFTPILADLKGFSLVAIDPLILSARDFGDAWTRVGPQVKSMFELMASSIRPLAQGLAGFVEEALPGLREALGNSGPIIAQFAHDLPMVGREFGNMFATMSRGEGVMKGMHFLMLTLAAVFKIVGGTIHGLSVAFDFLTRNGEKVSAFLAHIPLLGKPFEILRDAARAINDTGKEGGFITFSNGLDEGAVAAGRAAGAVAALDKAMGQLNEKLDAQVQSMTAAIDTQIAYEAAVDDLTQSIKDNGKNLDIHTAKGRDNVTAIEAVAKAAFAARDAFIEQNQSQMGLAGATQAANAAFKAQLDQLYLQLRGLGLADGAIQKLLGDWYALVAAPPAKLQVQTFYTQSGNAPPSAGRTTTGGGPSPRGGLRVFNKAGGLYAASGLLNQSAMFRAGPTMYGFAERGTGGEAFVARNADHGRSLAIANAAARWHGGHVVTGNGGGGHVTVELVAGRGAGTADRALAQLAQYAVRKGALQLRVVNGRLAV